MPDKPEDNIDSQDDADDKVEPATVVNAKELTQVVTKEEIASMIEQAGKVGRSHDAAIDIFNGIMMYAQNSRASDVHLEPSEDGAIVRVRVDGILHDMFVVTKELHIQMIAVLKVLTRMRTDEHRAPQDGRYDFKMDSGNVDVRVSIISVTEGEKAVLRLLSGASHELSLEDLGLFDTDLKRVQRAIERPWGMILATGPTGSGKTTTVYAILEILNQREINISTIEDPVEFDIEGVNQSQVDSSAKLTFASGLRSIVRQDPDIIMVGEIRDEETANIAINAALTGHKLLSTLHTNNAASTIIRLIDMKVEPFLISSTLICAIAQRLVRRVCDKCHKAKSWTKEEASKVLSPASVAEMFGDKDSVQVPDVVGCTSCGGTGYKGRVGIYEVLENTKEIQKLIVAGADSDTIQEQALKDGMTTIAQDGIRKVLDQITTIEELVRVMRE